MHRIEAKKADLSGKQTNCLNAGSPAEHIDRLNLLNAVSGLREKLRVTGQRSRVAGDIDNAGGA